MIRNFDRPLTIRRPFVEEMGAIRMTSEAARSRQLTVRPVWPIGRPDRLWTVSVTSEWPDGRQTFNQLDVVPTRQRLGGSRWWWRCLKCSRRCGVLLSPRSDLPFKCRRCWRALYKSDYRPRSKYDVLFELLGVKPDSLKEREGQFDFLNAPRRKGVRRGRRVRLRAVRLLGKVIRQQRQTQNCSRSSVRSSSVCDRVRIRAT